MVLKLKNWCVKYKKPLKITYGLVIISLIIYAFFSLYQETSLSSIEKAFRLLSWQKFTIAIILGACAVIPMVIYDFIYTKKAQSKVNWLSLLKNSYIINSFTNAGGSGGFVGATLRVYLFGKVKSKIAETVKVVSQIALFTLVGLITNDLVAIIINGHIFFQQAWFVKVICLLYPFYIFVPFIIPTKTLNLKDHFWLLIGSSLEWLFALGFFVILGFIIGLHFQPSKIYLAVIFAGIVGAISMIPGGAGLFDESIIFGLHNFGISNGMAIIWVLIYRICYYFIPFILGIIFLVSTVIVRKLKS